MKISHNEVLHVAKLACLDIDRNDLDMFAQQIGKILEYIEILNSVNTEGVEPTSHAILLTNAFRNDIEKEHTDNDAALLNAPEKDGGLFIVPKVIK